MYSHAGSFVRREVTAKTKGGKKVEVYYYDGNLNHMCAIGAATIAAEPMDFEKVFKHCDVLKVYELYGRKLQKETAEDRQKLLFEHFKLGRHFLERPDEVRYEDFVHYLQQESQKVGTQACVTEGRKFSHGRPKLTKAERTAKKNPKRAVSTQLVCTDVIAADAPERNADSTPRATETFPMNIGADDLEMD
jgi:hypothetical protein